jgi:hypothetical protein
MAETKTIELKVKTDMAGAISGVDKLKTGLKETTKNSNDLNNTLQGSKQSEFINKIGDGVGKLNPAFGSAVKGANGLILKMWEMVANPVGAILAGIVVTAKFLYEAFQSSVAGGKELKTIFAAISAVGAQVKDAIFGLGRALINVTTAAYKFITLDFKGAAEDMKKANGEATESWKQLGNAVDGTTFKLIKNLEKQQQINDKARKLQAVTQSETNKLLVQSREILTDETASIKEKKKALEEVTKAEKASSAEKVRIAAEDLRIAKEKAKGMGGEAEKKAKQELRELTIALNEAETENAMTGIKLNKQRKMLNRQETADAKEAADAQKEILKTKEEAEKTALKEKEEAQKKSFELAKTNVDEELKNTKLSIDEKRNVVLNNNKLSIADRQKYLRDLQQEEIIAEENHQKQIADLNKRYDDEKANRLADTAVKKEELDYQRRLNEINSIAQTELEKQTLIEKLDAEHKFRMGIARETDAENENKIEEKKLAQKKAIEDAKMQLLNSAFNAAKGLFEKNKGVQKAIIIAENAMALSSLVRSTIEAVGKATKASPLTIGMPWSGIHIAQGAIGATNIIASTTKALSAIGGGSAGGSPSMGGTAGGGGAAPQFNVVGEGGANQIAQSIAGRESQPVRAFVVGSDVTTQQGLNRGIVQNATLG